MPAGEKRFRDDWKVLWRFVTQLFVAFQQYVSVSYRGALESSIFSSELVAEPCFPPLSNQNWGNEATGREENP
jgi:hypothetical protein